VVIEVDLFRTTHKESEIPRLLFYFLICISILFFGPYKYDVC